jgi:hypothetical protein
MRRREFITLFGAAAVALAACRSWAVDDAANPSDDSEAAADRGGPCEA